MSRLRVFNVAGLMLNGRVDAVADTFQAQAAPSYLETFAPIPASRVLDPPATAIARLGERIDAFLARSAQEDPGATLVGIGRSFGGYLLLRAATERRARFEAFSLLVALEAPLAPDVAVGIPTLLPVLLPATRHYEERPRHAAEMVRALASLDGSRVLTMGSAVDSVVPPDAQRLPGAFTVTWEATTTVASAVVSPPQGLHVVLPVFAPGFALETALLPVDYRRHLSWHDDKHRLVNHLIVAACKGGVASHAGGRGA